MKVDMNSPAANVLIGINLCIDETISLINLGFLFPSHHVTDFEICVVAYTRFY